MLKLESDLDPEPEKLSEHGAWLHYFSTFAISITWAIWIYLLIKP